MSPSHLCLLPSARPQRLSSNFRTTLWSFNDHNDRHCAQHGRTQHSSEAVFDHFAHLGATSTVTPPQNVQCPHLDVNTEHTAGPGACCMCSSLAPLTHMQVHSHTTPVGGSTVCNTRTQPAGLLSLHVIHDNSCGEGGAARSYPPRTSLTLFSPSDQYDVALAPDAQCSVGYWCRE